MASPDFSPYIDLTVNDIQPPDIYRASVDYARIALPEFEPRAGSVEDALLQSFAYMCSSYIAAANRIPNGTIEGVLQLYGLTRREAGAGTIDVTITILTPGGTVESGTAFIYLVEEGGEIVQYAFATTSTLQAATGSTTISATLESLTLGSLPTIVVGTSLVVGQPSSEILSCVTTSPASSTDIEETDSEYFSRGVTYLESISTSLCMARQVEAYILSKYSSVTRCKVFDIVSGASTTPTSTTTSVVDKDASPDPTLVISVDATDPFFSFISSESLADGYTDAWITTPALRGDTTNTYDHIPSGLIGTSWTESSLNEEVVVSFTPDDPIDIADAGPSSIQIIGDLMWSVLADAAPTRTREPRGKFIVFVWGKDGYPVTVSERQAIYVDISSKIPIGITCFMMDAMPVDIYCEIEIEVADGYVSSTVLAQLNETVETYFSPESYPYWSEYLYKNEIIALASSVAGVKRVTSVTTYIPTYGTAPITSTTGAPIYGNDNMATTSSTSVQMIYAGSLPRFTVSSAVA